MNIKKKTIVTSLFGLWSFSFYPSSSPLLHSKMVSWCICLYNLMVLSGGRPCVHKPVSSGSVVISVVNLVGARPECIPGRSCCLV